MNFEREEGGGGGGGGGCEGEKRTRWKNDRGMDREIVFIPIFVFLFLNT